MHMYQNREWVRDITKDTETLADQGWCAEFDSQNTWGRKTKTFLQVETLPPFKCSVICMVMPIHKHRKRRKFWERQRIRNSTFWSTVVSQEQTGAEVRTGVESTTVSLPEWKNPWTNLLIQERMSSLYSQKTELRGNWQTVRSTGQDILSSSCSLRIHWCKLGESSPALVIIHFQLQDCARYRLREQRVASVSGVQEAVGLGLLIISCLESK